ncbi:MAG TPA: pyrimidine reductase family protein [Nocardioidaceae bacterium]|nr:pyrimidine reductase family protein [Nocardioidaceae bacterium]
MQMRRLHPDPAASVEVADAYALPTDGTRHLRVNMVSSVDGAAAVQGRVGVLSGAADQQLLNLLRALCDVLLVGAGTVRAEGYGPLELSGDQVRRRVDAGQSPTPRLAILTRSLDVDLAAPVFTEATARPLLITTELAAPERRRAAESVADVIVAGERSVALPTALDVLTERGMPRILSEGGPHVLAEMLADDLVDELCLAIAPIATCGEEPRITAGPALPVPTQLELAHVLERDQFLFLRYRRG